MLPNKTHHFINSNLNISFYICILQKRKYKKKCY